MAIKLKKHKENKVMKKENKNYLLSAIVFLLLIVCSISMIRLYPKIEKRAKEISLNDNRFYFYINRINYELYEDIIKENNEGSISYNNTFVKSIDKETLQYIYYGEDYNKYYGEKEYEEHYNDFVNNLESNISSTLEHSTPNLDYMVIKDNKILNKEQESSISKNVTLNEDGTLNYNKDVLSKKYKWCAIISYDSNGYCTIEDINGVIGPIARVLDSYSPEDVLGDYDAVELNGIKDTTFVYGITNELLNSGELYDYDYYLNDRYLLNILIYVLIIGAIVALVALIIPYRKENEMLLIKPLSKLPIEIKLIGLPLCIFFLSFMSVFLIRATGENWFYDALSYMDITQKTANIIAMLVNILYWILLYALIFFAFCSLKKIFKDGFKESIKENTIIYSIYRFIKRIIKKIIKYVSDIDLRDESNKKLLVLIGLNFVLLSVICMLWFFGIGALIIYSIVLFFIAKKYVDNIKEKYKKLLCATNKIAQGKLDVTIEEDLGIFEPFKEELDKIQKGFKKAVDEEVKSQRMKTELISNVSHDLKTPLTSIITYVDLLKQENITDEDRNKYIDTIDRKSQRLKKLIEDLFEMSKASSGNIKLNLMKVDIVSLMQQAQFELSDKISESSLEFRNNYPENKVILELDSEKTYRIFENLLINITKYSMKNSRVYIDIKDEEESVEITFRNISENEINFSINEIVERFVRGDKSRNTEGSGLGLSIAKSFVELQGGEFNIDIDGDLFKVTIRFKK